MFGTCRSYKTPLAIMAMLITALQFRLSILLLLQRHLLAVLEAFSAQTAHLLQSSRWVLHPKETPFRCSQVGVVAALNNGYSVSAVILACVGYE